MNTKYIWFFVPEDKKIIPFPMFTCNIPVNCRYSDLSINMKEVVDYIISDSPKQLDITKGRFISYSNLELLDTHESILSRLSENLPTDNSNV